MTYCCACLTSPTGRKGRASKRFMIMYATIIPVLVFRRLDEHYLSTPILKGLLQSWSLQGTSMTNDDSLLCS